MLTEYLLERRNAFWEITGDSGESLHNNVNVNSANLAIQLAAGLGHLHDISVLHRDLKPNNILVEYGARSDTAVKNITLKITDFGLAVGLGDRSASQMGSVYYQAPEVLTACKTSEASDVYALALVIWQLFCAVPKLVAYPRQMHAINVVEQGWRPALPPGLLVAPARLLLSHCWRENPADRPTSGELRAELAELIEELRAERRSSGSLTGMTDDERGDEQKRAAGELQPPSPIN
jgi:serine/threonine protein kinase